jgi:hypothetical protein
MQIGTFWRGEVLPLRADRKPQSQPGADAATPATIASGAAVLDELLLSSEAEQTIALPRMSDMSASRFLPGAKLDEPLRIENLKGEYDNRLADFKSRFSALLRARGIESEQELRLKIAADGQVVVATEHARRGEVEQMFREVPQLRNQFAAISGQASLLEAAREAVEFQRAYREDPLQALREFRHLFERTEQPLFSLSLVGDVWHERMG